MYSSLTFPRTSRFHVSCILCLLTITVETVLHVRGYADYGAMPGARFRDWFRVAIGLQVPVLAGLLWLWAGGRRALPLFAIAKIAYILVPLLAGVGGTVFGLILLPVIAESVFFVTNFTAATGHRSSSLPSC